MLLIAFMAVSACAFALVVLSSRVRQKRIKEADQLREFFGDASNYRHGNHINQIAATIGPWDSCDDWDWGRVMYEWVRPGLRVAVGTDSGLIRTVHFLDPLNSSRYGTVVKTVLDESFDFQRGSMEHEED